MSEKIERAGAALPDLPTGRLWTPPVGLSGCVLMGLWSGFWIHWMGQRTLPCLGAKCPAARHRRPVYWMGYCPCQARSAEQSPETAVKDWPLQVVALSVENAHRIQQRELSERLPFAITFRRAPRSRVAAVASIGPVGEGYQVQSPFSVLPTLARVWGMRPTDLRNELAYLEDGELINERGPGF